MITMNKALIEIEGEYHPDQVLDMLNNMLKELGFKDYRIRVENAEQELPERNTERKEVGE